MALSYGFCLGEENLTYSSKEFSDAFQAVFGDGITQYGGKFVVTANDTMQLSIATGFALVAGRWIKSDSVDTLSVQPADNHYDRYDAVIIRVDFAAKSVNIIMIQGAATAFPKPYIPIRNNEVYELVLYSILVRTGITQITEADLVDMRADIDLCGFITPLETVAKDILSVYDFLASGIDKKVSELEDMAQSISDAADQAIQGISNAMGQANISKTIGEIEILHTPPNIRSVWLLCDGGDVPMQYSTLYALLNGKLPSISQPDDRFQAWIYAGAPS